MSAPVIHAQTTVDLFGGHVDDYIPIHEWLDDTKQTFADFRHRALRHHAYGVLEAERTFGAYVTNSDGKLIPVRYIAEQHIREDCDGRVPSVEDWLELIKPEVWMNRKHKISLGSNGRQT